MARQTFQRKAIVLVPNCNWTGHECDLMVVTNDLRVIDVEVKISRADLKADAKKDKWWHRQYGAWNPETRRQDMFSTARHHPPRVWKHYYALPAAIWDDKLLDCLASPSSGVIILREGRYQGDNYVATVVRRATPCKDAQKLTPAQAVDVARLANLRYWDACAEADRLRRELRAANDNQRATA